MTSPTYTLVAFEGPALWTVSVNSINSPTLTVVELVLSVLVIETSTIGDVDTKASSQLSYLYFSSSWLDTST